MSWLFVFGGIMSTSSVDNEFAEKIFMFLPGYNRKGYGFDFRLNARCPVCNDHSPRFWYYSNKNRIVCYNCGVRSNVRYYIENYQPDLLSQYLLERRKSYSGLSTNKAEDSYELYNKKSKEIKSVVRTVESIPHSVRLDLIPDKNHPIIRYVSERKIPEEAWNRLWFTMEWRKVANFIKPDTYPPFAEQQKEPRLVIPIYNENGKIESIQGRDLSGRSKAKYLTIKTDDDSTKIFGQDLIVPSMTVWVLEGPIDSMFIKNSIAVTGGEISLDVLPYKGNRVWVMDNEPRSPDTIKRMERLIRNGESIVIFDRSPWMSKDINDMVRFDGATPEQLIEYFRENNYSGPMAELRLQRWKKI